MPARRHLIQAGPMTPLCGLRRPPPDMLRPKSNLGAFNGILIKLINSLVKSLKLPEKADRRPWQDRLGLRRNGIGRGTCCGAVETAAQIGRDRRRENHCGNPPSRLARRRCARNRARLHGPVPHLSGHIPRGHAAGRMAWRCRHAPGCQWRPCGQGTAARCDCLCLQNLFRVDQGSRSRSPRSRRNPPQC